MDGNPIIFPRSKASRIAALFDVVVYMAKIFAAPADCVYSAFVRCVAFSWPTATDGDSGEPKRRHYFDSPSERNARRASKRNQKCNKHILSHSRTSHTHTHCVYTQRRRSVCRRYSACLSSCAYIRHCHARSLCLLLLLLLAC